MDQIDFTGLEPELGGERRLPDTADDDYTSASPHFQQAIRHIDNKNWQDAAGSMHFVTGIVPYDRLTARLYDILRGIAEGDDSASDKQIAMLQSFLKRARAGEIDTSSEAAQRAGLASPLLADIPPALDDDEPELEITVAEIESEKQPIDLPTPTPLQVAYWAFFQPALMNFYAAEEDHLVLEDTGAVFVNTLMWLPIIIASASMAALESLTANNFLGWLPVLLVIFGLLVMNWLAANNGFPQAMVVAAGIAFIMAIFASGMLTLFSGPLLILCVVIAAGIAPAIGGVKLGIMVRRIASGFAIVVATLVVTLLYNNIMGVAQRFIGGAAGSAGASDIFILGLAFLLGGLALTGVLMLSFGLVFAMMALLSYLTGFFMSAALETNFETHSSAGGLFPLSLLVLSNGALFVICLVRIWQVLL